MRTIVWVWLGLLAGAGLLVAITRDAGYVHIVLGVHSIEMSLALLVLLIVLLFVLVYVAIRFSVQLWRTPRRMQDWNNRRHLRLARLSLTRGLLELSEGRWKSAEKHLLKYADRSETPLLNYLSAARAAQLQGEHERRDGYLSLAHESMPSADVAVGLTQAELQLAHHQMEQALATLKHLRTVAPKHIYVLRLLRRLYEQLGDWEQLKELLPELRSRKVEDKQSLYQLEIRVHGALLDRAAEAPAKARLGMVWDQVPRNLRGEPELLADYTTHLITRGDSEQVEPLLRDALRHGFDEHLVELYGQVQGADLGKQLLAAESALKEHPDNPTLLLALGRICLRSKLWGKARGYLEASIGADGPADAYRELGHLLEQMGEQGRALGIYRQGLTETGGPEPIPLPEHIGPASSNQPLLQDDPTVDPPPPHGAAPVPDPS